MKAKHFIVLLALVLFSSCIVKSLRPFYVEEALEFQEVFLGKWKDQSNDIWEVSSVKELYEAEKADTSKTITEEDLKLFKKYRKGYYLSYIQKDENKDDIENHFIAMPFKVNNETLIDFIPFYIGEINNHLPQLHLLKTHSVAKFNYLEDGKLKLYWLKESKLNELYENNKIKLNREVVGVGGIEDDFVLSATSREIYKFLEKYLNSNEEDIWSSDTKFSLNKIGSVRKEDTSLIKNY